MGTEREGHDHEGGDDEEIGDCIADEDPGGPDKVVGHAADDRTDHAGRIHLGRVQRDGAGEIIPADQGRDDGGIGRAVHGIADADEEDHHHQEDVRRRGCSHDPGQTQREDELLDREQDQKLLAVDLVGDEATYRGQEQGRSELGENDDADEGARMRDVVGVGTQHDVLHPGADVGRECTEVDDAECAMAQGGAGGPRRYGAVPIDNRVLDLLEGDGALTFSPRPCRHPSIVRDCRPAGPFTERLQGGIAR